LNDENPLRDFVRIGDEVEILRFRPGHRLGRLIGAQPLQGSTISSMIRMDTSFGRASYATDTAALAADPAMCFCFT